MILDFLELFRIKQNNNLKVNNKILKINLVNLLKKLKHQNKIIHLQMLVDQKEVEVV